MLHSYRRTQKAAAIAASCNIHPLRKQLFKVGAAFSLCASRRAAVERSLPRACLVACVLYCSRSALRMAWFRTEVGSRPTLVLARPAHPQVHPAPGPEEVNWESLWFTHAQRVRRGFLVTPFIVVLVLLPVSMLTSAMSQLNDTLCDEHYPMCVKGCRCAWP